MRKDYAVPALFLWCVCVFVCRISAFVSHSFVQILFRLLNYRVQFQSQQCNKKGFECSFLFFGVYYRWGQAKSINFDFFSCAPFFSTHNIHIVCFGPGNYHIHKPTYTYQCVCVCRAATWFKKELNYQRKKKQHTHTYKLTEFYSSQCVCVCISHFVQFVQNLHMYCFHFSVDICLTFHFHHGCGQINLCLHTHTHTLWTIKHRMLLSERWNVQIKPSFSFSISFSHYFSYFFNCLTFLNTQINNGPVLFSSKSIQSLI